MELFHISKGISLFDFYGDYGARLDPANNKYIYIYIYIYNHYFCSTNTSSISIMIASASIIRKCLYFSLNLNELDLNRPIDFQPLTKWKNIA